MKVLRSGHRERQIPSERSLLAAAGLPGRLKDSQGSFTELRGLVKPLHNPGPSTGSAGTTGVSDNRPEKSWSWLCPRSPSAAASIQLPPACGSGSLSTFGKRQFKKNAHSSYSVLAFPSIVFLLTWQPSGLASSPLLFSFFFFF